MLTCPMCRSRSQVAQLKYSELGPDNELVPVNVAELTCGCRVPMAQIQQPDAGDWLAATRRRMDDNLRQIFS